jgi:hypothetical protein
VHSPSTYVERRRSGTYGMLGRTSAGRGLLVILAPRCGVPGHREAMVWVLTGFSTW